MGAVMCPILEVRIIVIKEGKDAADHEPAVAPSTHPVNNKVGVPGGYLFAYPSNHSIFNC